MGWGGGDVLKLTLFDCVDRLHDVVREGAGPVGRGTLLQTVVWSRQRGEAKQAELVGMIAMAELDIADNHHVSGRRRCDGLMTIINAVDKVRVHDVCW